MRRVSPSGLISSAAADGVGARSLKQDYGDINKSLKMAEKSAHIDATLRMAGLSEVFTQDIEDMIHGQKLETKTENARPDRVPVPTAPPGAPEKITAAQQRRLEARIAELGLEHERVRDWAMRLKPWEIWTKSRLPPSSRPIRPRS